MKKILLYTVAMFAFTSCTKYLDVNQNPNTPEDVPPSTLLPTTTIGVAWANGNELGRAAGLIMQYNAGLANNALSYDVYNLAAMFNNQWDYELYNGSINNLQILINKTQATSPAYSGIAKIQMAYAFSMATDLWGDVPYSQAGQGTTYLQPRYDKQQDIYLGNSASGIKGLLNLVREGIADLDKTSVLKPGSTDDVVYKGDLSKWKRAGNSLLLKLAIQLTNVAADTAKSVITSVVAGNNFINDNSLDFSVPFKTDINNQNPIYAQDVQGSFKNGEMLSSRFLTLMKAQNDTVRLAKFYTKPSNAFVGYTNGATITAPALATRSMYNTYVVGVNGEAPLRLITNFQTKFILAEAALTLDIAGDPNQYYQDGIKASMQLAGMSSADITQYFNDNPTIVTLTGTTDNKLQQIITQKYIAWVGNGIESYNDYRRTGYPVLALPLNASGDNPAVIPKRFPYTTNEGSRNPNQPSPRPKTDVKVWWGK